MTVALDCLVIGGGPAGLTAAIYLTRFRLSVRVIDEGRSRAALIPKTRNQAGFPGGIAGVELLDRMRTQALEYGAEFHTGRIDRLERTGQAFKAHSGAMAIDAKTVLIATGVTNLRPAMADALHAAALGSGRLRYCPVCDGFEVIDQRVAVIGTGARGVKEALFLRSYTRSVTLIPNDGPPNLTAEEQHQLATASIIVVEAPAVDFQLEADVIGLTAGADRLCFDAVYPALGSDIHSELAGEVGADRTEDGCIKVDAHQRTSVPFLYAAGDVVIGLDQISHAMGEAGVAATAIRNDLAEVQPLLR